MKKFVLALSLAVGLVLPFSVVTAFANAPESTEQPPVTINYADDDCVYSSQIKIEDVTLNDTDFNYPSSDQKSFTAYINSSVVGDFNKITWLEQDTALPESFLIGNDGNIEPVAAGNVISLYVNSDLFGTATVRTALTYPVLNEAVTYVAVDGGVNVTLTGAILNEGELLMVAVGDAAAVAYDVPVAVDGTYTIFVAYDFPVGDTVITFTVIPLCEVDADEHPAVIASVTVNVAEVIIITADPDEVDFGSAIENYTAIAKKTVTITNNGNTEQTLTLSDDNFQFVVVIDISGDGMPIDIDEEAWRDGVAFSLEPGASADIAVRPRTGLVPSDYELELMHNDVVYCTLTFEVTAVQYAEITADPNEYDFDPATVGYDEIDPIEVTFTNSGNIDGTVSFDSDDAFDLLVGDDVWNGIVPAGESVVVSISPKIDLAVGTYTLDLDGYCTLSFEVTAGEIVAPEISLTATGVSGEAILTIVNEPVDNTGLDLTFVGYEYSLDDEIWVAIEAGDAITGLIDDVENIVYVRAAYEDAENVAYYSEEASATVTPYEEDTAVDYTVTYYLAGGKLTDGTEVGEPYVVETNTEADYTVLTADDVERIGYNFGGWFIDEDYVNEFDGLLDGEDVTLYAKWDVITYTIIWELSDGEYDFEYEPLLGYTVELEYIVLPYVTGGSKTFLGWRINDTTYVPGDPYYLTAGGDLTITAVYEKELDYDVLTAQFDERTTALKTAVAKVGSFGVLTIVDDNDNEIITPGSDYAVEVTSSNAAVVKVYYDQAKGVWMYQTLKAGTVILQVKVGGVSIYKWTLSVKA